MRSLVYFQGLVSSTVTVPWSGGTQTTYPVNQAQLFSCSGPVVDPSGIILTAGHCADTQSPEIHTWMVDYAYVQLVRQRPDQSEPVLGEQCRAGLDTLSGSITLSRLLTCNVMAGLVTVIRPVRTHA
jgi:hypothetical protein